MSPDQSYGLHSFVRLLCFLYPHLLLIQAARRGKERGSFLINAQLCDELTNSRSGGAASAPHSSPFSNLHHHHHQQPPPSQAASSLMYCQKAPMAHQDPSASRNRVDVPLSASAAAAASTLFCSNTPTQVSQHYLVVLLYDYNILNRKNAVSHSVTDYDLLHN